MDENQIIRYFNINWNSKTDGKGVRTVIFLQGCNLACPWCHSPHSQPSISPILLNLHNCDFCGTCAQVCGNKVHSFKPGVHIVNSESCISCGVCISHCHRSQNSNHQSMNALFLPTIEVTPEELFEKVYPQLDLLKYSGGVTISGGEPMLQYKSLIVFLKACKAEGILTTVETSGSVPFLYFQKISKYVDDWLFGLRPVNKDYAPYVANLDLVLENLKQLSQITKAITIRVPLIKGVLESERQMDIIKKAMISNGLKHIELLPFNPYTDHYYTAMGKDFLLKGNRDLSIKTIKNIQSHFEEEDIVSRVVQF